MSPSGVFHRGALACVGLVAIGAFSSPAFGQPIDAPTNSRTMLSGQMDLPRLVDLCAERLKVAVEYDPAVLKGSVTLRLGSSGDPTTGGLTDAELWSLMNELLASRGFTTVRQPGAKLLSVVRVSDAAVAAALELPAGEGGVSGLQAANEPGFASLVVRLKHRAPKDVIDTAGKALTRAVAGGTSAGSGSIVALGDPNVPRGLVLISDLSPRIEQAMALIELIDTPSSGSVVESVTVSNVAPAAMATLVAQVTAKRELVSGEKVSGEVLPLPRGGSVLVIAPPERVEYWRTLIQSLDQGSGEGVEQRTYVPKAFASGDVAGLIEQTAREVRGPSGELLGDASDDRWKLVIDDLTGALVITATPTQHAAIGKLLERLESTPPAAKYPVRSFVIQNRNVKDLLPIVQDLMQTGILGASAELGGDTASAVGSSPSTDVGAARVPSDAKLNTPTTGALNGGSATTTQNNTRPSGAAATNLGTVPADTGNRDGERSTRTNSTRGRGSGSDRRDTLALSADESTNTLIAMGEPRLLEQLEALIHQLDTRQAQVMLEVLLVSLTDNQTMDLGVELEKLNIGLGGETRGRLASLFGIANRAGDVPVVGGSGGQAIVLNPGDFSVVLRALQTLNKGRSLSMPSILIKNNEEASLDSILEQPFATTNTNNSVTSSTSFGGSLPAGTQLSIKPQIAEGDHLTLDYQVSLSSFTGSSSNPNLPPPRQQNKVQSVATIPDGHTVVVGGIDLNTDNQGTSQVPLLAEIPILGEAFKSRSNNRSKQKFYVFIRANILRSRSFEDLKYLSEVRTSEVGVDDGFPEVEPRVIR